MNIRVLSTAVPVMVVGGMILFLGCGAESKNAERNESSGAVSPSVLANTPAKPGPTDVPAESLPKTVAGRPSSHRGWRKSCSWRGRV